MMVRPGGKYMKGRLRFCLLLSREKVRRSFEPWNLRE
jgi:hypothetical protein